jgi:hypothetical protein
MILFCARKLLPYFIGIVSRDWGGLQIVSLYTVDRKFKVFWIRFIFDFKMAPIRVRFSPGCPPGAGFPGEENAPAWL